MSIFHQIIKTIVITASISTTSLTLANSMPTVTIRGQAILTYPTDTNDICKNELKKNGCDGQKCDVAGKTLTFSKCTAITLTFQGGTGACSNSQAEFFLSPNSSTYDISLVNGFSGAVSISGGSRPVSAENEHDLSRGVYGFGCSTCTARTKKDCGFSSLGATKGCSARANCQITNDNSKAYVVTFD